MNKTLKAHFNDYISISFHDNIISIAIFALTILLCMCLNEYNDSNTFISIIFVMAVFLISRFTTGYLYGTLFSLISVLAVNYIFTYPAFEFNFSKTGYPMTMVCMLIVSFATSSLTTQIKRHSEIQLEAEKEKTRSNLLRAISHDLRTPLTSILGASDAIISNDDLITKDERLKLLNEIKDDSQWLIRMVENLLSITRIDGDSNAKIAKTPEAAEEVVSESVMKFQKQFPDNQVCVSVPEELLIVPMDAILIKQVIINILENSAIHSGTATQINVNLYKKDNNAVFEISDNGKGIDQSIISDLFEGKLRISDEKYADKKKNMGIGLSVCNTIIKVHNGKLKAYNAKNGGAVFKFTLPLEEVE